MRLQLTYTIRCTKREFWKTYVDPEFTRHLHDDALGSTSLEIVEQEGSLAKGLRRTLRYGQRPDMPGPVRKLFGSEVVTTETGTYDPPSDTWTFELTPGTLADKTQIRGSFVVAQGRTTAACQQSFTLEARVKIFGVGPIVEKFIESQARQTQDRAAAFMNEWLARR